MMKIIILVVLLAVTIPKSYAGGEFFKYVADCKTSEKATDTDFANWKAKVKPPTKEMKCLTTCLAEKLGLISNNLMSADGIMTFAKTVPTANDQMVQGMSEIVEQCKSIQDPDRCEFGAKLTDCLMEGTAKKSIKLFMH